MDARHDRHDASFTDRGIHATEQPGVRVIDQPDNGRIHVFGNDVRSARIDKQDACYRCSVFIIITKPLDDIFQLDIGHLPEFKNQFLSIEQPAHSGDELDVNLHI